MFRSFGAPEIILILVIILIFFGVGKLPQVGSALGKGMRAFRRGQSGDDGDADDAAEDVPVAQKPRKAASVKKAASK
jgi:sec-independent protein translocase protein TatA